METIKLLILDDLSIIRDGIRHILKNQKDIEIIAESDNCENAIKYLDENPNSIDILIMDVKFTASCAVNTTKVVLKKNKKIKILALTLQGNETSITEILKAGAMGYVLKEEAHELISAIRKVADGNKYFSNKVSVKLINPLITPKKTKDATLSDREKEILNYIAEGETNRGVGKILSISGRTVETHRKNIISKLDVRNTAEMIKHAINNQLIV